MAEGRGGVVKRFQHPFLLPAAPSGLNSAPAQDSRRRLCSRIGSRESPVLPESGSRLVSLYLQRSFVRGFIRFDNKATFRTIKVGNIRLEFFRAFQSKAAAGVRFLLSARRQSLEVLGL